MSVGSKRRRGRGGYFLSLVALAVCGFIAWWALATLFPAELRQTGQWFEAKFESLRK